tara:strand:+ start:625 stop:915 length:291 start_codon:yes stop_codon:yes gene_type:complete
MVWNFFFPTAAFTGVICVMGLAEKAVLTYRNEGRKRQTPRDKWELELYERDRRVRVHRFIRERYDVASFSERMNVRYRTNLTDADLDRMAAEAEEI